MNTSWQTAYLAVVNNAHTLTKDSDGNAIIVFNLSSLAPSENAAVSYSVKLEERSRSPPKISLASSGNLSEIPEKLKEEYGRTVGSWIIDEDLKSLANMIWASQGKTPNVLRIASAFADWIGRNIKSVSHDIPYYPDETYLSNEGDCDDQANLLIALCRTLGIPAYLQIGSLRWSSQNETFWNGHITSDLMGITYHGWAVVYVPPWGWLPFDMTRGWSISDSLSVITSASIWSLSAMAMSNITKSDWPGEGRAQKTSITSSSIYINYDETLTIRDSEGLQFLLDDWRFWRTIITVISVSAVIAVTLERYRHLHLEKP
ncbi:MAG: transglutaminase family protein [Candidatus Bathyarchaeota archaeon]